MKIHSGTRKYISRSTNVAFVKTQSMNSRNMGERRPLDLYERQPPNIVLVERELLLLIYSYDFIY